MVREAAKRGGGESSSDGDGGKRARLDVVSHQATSVHALSAKLEWRIDHFEKLMKLFRNGQNIISNQFSCERAPECVWELHVYPNGKREEDAQFVSFFLRQVGLQAGTEPIMTEFQIYCLDSNMQRVSVCRDTKDFTHQQGRGKFQVTRDKMQAAIRSEGDIVLVCDVEYFAPGSKLNVEEVVGGHDSTDVWWSSRQPNVTFDNNPKLTIDMLRDDMFTDTVIKVGSTPHILRVHRCILALHSTVFRNMFESEHMVEAQNGVVHIHDATYEAIRAMVEYMYTGDNTPTCAPKKDSFVTAAADDSTTADVEHGEHYSNYSQSCPFDLTAAVEENTRPILAIADKYDVIPLKYRCERVLARRLTAETVCELLLFADTYSCRTLQRACVSQLRADHAAVLATDEWKSLKADHPNLANQLLESIVCGHDIGGLLPGTSASVRVVANPDVKPSCVSRPSVAVENRRNPPRQRNRPARNTAESRK